MLSNNVKYRVGIIAVVFFIQFMLQLNQSFAQKAPTNKNLTKPLEKNIVKDTSKTNILKDANDTTPATNQVLRKINTIDSLKLSKDSLDAPVKYQAQDSGVLIMATQAFYLYGKSNVKYNSINLDANVIQYNGSKQTVKAFGAMDTTNNPLNKAKMQDGQNTTYADTLEYCFKTQKGRSVNAYYTEGELFTQVQVLKKVDSTSFYGYNAKFTTCNLDTPHFAFRTKRMKMISNKLAVSGPAFPEFEGVPMPIGIPFGIFPLSKGRHSGVLAPQFTTSEDYGIGLEGLGYYKVINDNFDVTLRSNLYSYGGWSLNVNPKYIVRYKYNGMFNITFQNTKSLNRFTSSKDEFTNSKTFDVTWTHNKDNKARPGTTFGANVHFGSTRFNRTVLNNPYINFNNRINSSISYSKNFNNKANLSLNLNHDQNASDRSVNLQLPTASFSVITFYPFQKKDRVGAAKWYENLGVGYSGSFNNRISFYDSAISIKHLLDTMQWSATHNIPISISLPALGPVTVSPSVSYNETWYDRVYVRNWNSTTKKIDSSTSKLFQRRPTTSFGLSLSTRIFGLYQFKHSKSVKAIRHEIRPSIGFNYTPDIISNYLYSVQIDTAGRRVNIDRLTGNRVDYVNTQGSLTFSLDNILEMKVKDKTDTSGKKDKKVRLLDVFNISTAYNLAADSFAWQPFSLRLATNLFEKINISAGAILNPYNVDSAGNLKKTLMWQNDKFSLGRITGGNVAISTQLKSKPTDEKKAKQKTNPNDPFMTPDEQQRQLEYARSNPAEFTDFNIPWTLSLSYSLSFTRVPKKDYSGFQTSSNSSLNFNGDFNLSPKWKMGATGYYDFTTSKLQQLNFFVSREMHCWQLSINVTPVNILRSFSITISPKSGMLRDLKINRTRQFSN